jgi:YbbR domain-containing protein
MKGAVRWLRAAVLDNIFWKLLALLIAALLWALVAGEPELSSFFNTRVQFQNLPEDLEISSEPATSVLLELRGPSAELADGAARPAVVLDMSGVQPGERTFVIGPGTVKLARGVRLVRAIPSELHFSFERRASRSVTVMPRFTGEGENGYTVASWEVQPNELMIVGPASRVALLSSVDTDPVDVTGVVGAAEFHVNAFMEDPYIRFQTSPRVKVSVTMKKQ